VNPSSSVFFLYPPYTRDVRTWVKVTIGGAALVALAYIVLAGTGAYFVLRNLDTRTTTEADATRELDALRGRFGARPPLVEINDARSGDIRINRDSGTEAKPITTLHVLAWKTEDHELVRMEVPLWLARFSAVNVLSKMGVGPANLRLTVQDIERYGPGIVIDFGKPGADRAVVWTD
jgi:hypothetical protein